MYILFYVYVLFLFPFISVFSVCWYLVLHLSWVATITFYDYLYQTKTQKYVFKPCGCSSLCQWRVMYWFKSALTSSISFQWRESVTWPQAAALPSDRRPRRHQRTLTALPKFIIQPQRKSSDDADMYRPCTSPGPYTLTFAFSVVTVIA